ncbi:hypothetical protein [Geopseudomonas aromaticivorans]
MKRSESLDRNQVFKLHQELGNARDIKPRVEIFDTLTDNIGVRVVVLLDYRLLSDNPRFRQHALAAEMLFDELSPRQYDEIMRDPIARSRSGSDAVCEEARRQGAQALLATGKAVCISRDPELLALAGQHGVAEALLTAIAQMQPYAGEDLKTTRGVIASETVNAQARASLNTGLEQTTAASVRADAQRPAHFAWGPILERERVNAAPDVGL